MTNPQLPPDQDPKFTPPFCPNSSCPFHLRRDGPWPWKKNGTYIRRSDKARFQVYKCLHCRRGFSSRTFCADYWLQKRDLLPRIADLLCNGAALRQAARHLDVSHSTIARHLARAGRHCLLFHQEQIRNLEIREPVVVDGFETFEYSQYFPFHINLAAGRDSWFLYGFTDSPLRRKGRMTLQQKRRREELEREYGRPDPKAVEIGMTRLFESLLEHVPVGHTLQIESDEHPAYPRALKRVRRERPDLARTVQRTTSSREARTAGNPLFAANLADLLLRHSGANHRRETIAFSKRRMSAISRTSVFVVWRNCVKRRRENGGEETAAMTLGLATHPLRWSEVFRTRLFPGRAELGGYLGRYYRSEVWTPVLGDRQGRHDLKLAF